MQPLVIGLLYHPWMIDGDDCGPISELMSGKGTEVFDETMS
jgi:hypothetical protein